MRTQTGFTLIELIVVVAIIAIIAAIAIPAYNEQARKARRADASRFVGQLQLDLERWRAENPCYGISGGAGCPTAFVASGNYPNLVTLNAASPNYTIAIPTATPTAYSITATPKAAQNGVRCGVLTLTRTPANQSGKPQWANAACN
jgi:type IV pilus assembly protein PilE